MTVRDCIAETMAQLAEEHKAVFIGYNTMRGGRVYGTLKNVPEAQCAETPIAENLMAGMALGMSLQGMLPVVCYERHDFTLFGIGMLATTLDKFSYLSGREKVRIVVRSIRGASKPLDAGVQHTGDYEECIKRALPFSRFIDGTKPYTTSDVFREIDESDSGMVVIFEERDTYDTEATWKKRSKQQQQ